MELTPPAYRLAVLYTCHYDFFRKDLGRCRRWCCPGAAAAALAPPPAAANLANRSAANRRQGLVLREWRCCRVVQVRWSGESSRRSTPTRRRPACQSGSKRKAWCSCYRLHVPPGTVSDVCRLDQYCRRDLVRWVQQLKRAKSHAAPSAKCDARSVGSSAMLYSATD